VELEVLGLKWEESFGDKLVVGSVEIICKPKHVTEKACS